MKWSIPSPVGVIGIGRVYPLQSTRSRRLGPGPVRDTRLPERSDAGIDEPLAMSRSWAASYFSVNSPGSVVATKGLSGVVAHSAVFDTWWSVNVATTQPSAPGAYTVPVRVTDSQGHAVEGQILTTIEY